MGRGGGNGTGWGLQFPACPSPAGPVASGDEQHCTGLSRQFPVEWQPAVALPGTGGRPCRYPSPGPGSDYARPRPIGGLVSRAFSTDAALPADAALRADAALPADAALGRVELEALGTTAVLLVRPPEALEGALAVLQAELAAIDAAASRFRDDSELVVLNREAGHWCSVSPLLWSALGVALRAARLSEGAVSPTIGRSMRLIGYDCDFALVAKAGPALSVKMAPAPGWAGVELGAGRRVRLAAGVELDLGATAKALAADRVATRAVAQAAPGAGVLVSLGGDMAMAGAPPAQGWHVRVTDDHRGPADAPGQDIWLHDGALATSSATVRTWHRGGQRMHHIVDPSTGLPAQGPWRTVSVAAASCVDANTAATAAIVKGASAVAWLEARDLPARLVDWDGAVTPVAGWPVQEPGPARERALRLMPPSGFRA